MNRRAALASLIGLGFVLVSFRSPKASAPQMHLVKDPNCGCCTDHAAYLQAHGFAVTIEESTDLDQIRRQRGIPDHLAGCHSIFVEGYVIEGHVPAAAIRKLLAERPAIKGIALPGMPPGSPGMSGTREGPLLVLVIDDGIMPRTFWSD
ncbi:hypothetical protein A8950_2156 [Dongia mobilis]|uniref:Metal-binding protein n=1 Tax=Dongia mobilis TaxID=578943 RepID=A0A4R6WTC1_9PROT|nr:DUF411 domain-containing protein [Dongia mobilis]TDQ82334.1 hypothetical protein A8950_2156 [Dongia mobilis]